jgi:dienelactone hydrolase
MTKTPFLFPISSQIKLPRRSHSNRFKPIQTKSNQFKVFLSRRQSSFALGILPLCLAILCLTCCTAVAQSAAQKETLEHMLRLFPKSQAWEAWLRRSGELPPNFAALPDHPYLPDPLKFTDGSDVRREDWPRRRQELLAMFQQYVIGSVPPSPGNVRAARINSREEPGALIDEVLLEFGPDYRARLRMELIIPRGRTGPFPVFVTQDNHRGWALVAVSRGYIGCVYAGADSRDDTGPWVDIWPQYDWTKLTRRAWAASRCIDYLHQLPVVDTNRIALTGHSRNGKLALIAAAIDWRVNAVISSSSGAGGACSYRLFSEAEFGEGIELITRAFPDWFHPRLRFFAGRESKLPIDQHELIACIAPRPCLISTALNDSVESVWAVEQTYYSARRVYQLLDKPDELNLRYRPGGHETHAEDIEGYLDWLDTVFGGRQYPFPDVAIFPRYNDWVRYSGEKIDAKSYPSNGLQNLLVGAGGKPIASLGEWARKRESIRQQVLWGLGEAPPFGQSGPRNYGAEPAHTARLLDRGSVPGGIQKRSVTFGNYIAGDLYFQTNHGSGKLPAIVWLHPISVSNGYVPGYGRGEHPHLAMARLGFAVFAFDQIGHGSRINEIRHFYARYPRWSVLGKMVEDTLAAVEALQAIDTVDSRRILLLGYGPGGMAALHAAALDTRVAAVISVNGFTPMRTNRPDKPGGGLARWSGWLPLQPRLGPFIGHESRVPYEYDEVLAMIAPRPALIFAAQIDSAADIDDIRRCISEARQIYTQFGASENLHLVELDDYSRFSPETQKVVYDHVLKTLKPF